MRKVIQFHPLHEAMIEIGPNLGDEIYKCWKRIRTKDGSIHCAPFGTQHKAFQIIPKDGGGIDAHP